MQRIGLELSSVWAGNKAVRKYPFNFQNKKKIKLGNSTLQLTTRMRGSLVTTGKSVGNSLTQNAVESKRIRKRRL